MGTITVKGIKLYAHHGCMPEETLIGSDYEVNVVVESNLDTSSESDDLSDTVDYVSIHAIVKQEMAIPSKLLEHVVRRIIQSILSKHASEIEALEVSVAKINPPINGDVRYVEVKDCYKR